MHAQSISDFVLDEQPLSHEIGYRGLLLGLVVSDGVSIELERASSDAPRIVRELLRCDEG